MPKPKSKQELVAGNEELYEDLNKLIDSLSAEEQKQEFPFQHRDRNLRDLLAHLLEWQLMMFDWYEIGMAGGQPKMPASGFSWRTTPKLNQQIWEKYQTKTLKLVRSKLQKSHDRLQKLIQGHSDNELFSKRHYYWTGSTSLGAYMTSAGWSHYGWALKLVRRFAVALMQRS